MAVDELLVSMAAELKEQLVPQESEDVRLVQKAMMLYRSGMVQQLRIDEAARKVTATIQDVVPVKVELDLDFPQMSVCACPGMWPCRHQLAAFFTAYAQVASVGDWVEEWREPAREMKQVTSWGLKQAKDLVKANGVLKPDYERWVETLSTSFDAIMKSKNYSSPYVVPELFQIYERRVLAGSPQDQEWRPLYELISNVVSFQKLTKLSAELGHTEDMVKRAYLHLLHQLVDDAEELTEKIGQRTHPFDFDEFVAKFSADCTDTLVCAQGIEYERIYLYRMLWTNLFKKKAWREEESERIKARLKQLEEWQNPLPLMIAGIHQCLMLENEERAMAMMDMLEERQLVPYLLFWIDHFTEMKAWKRAEPVVEALVARVRHYLEFLPSYHACSSFIRLAVKSISPYCAETGRLDLYERALLQTLPYSFYEYEQLLFTKGQYDRWGELYSFVGIPFSDLPKDRVKVVEKEQPEVLFALLHQTVQHEIDLKNRSSYKTAVRHLKKLRTLYKKTKRLDEWQFFFNTLLEKTKRLRAFHEECKRSKLIDA
ncbi:SWIM zinc finger family protein [Bacillus sp. EB600]|uniref:SWIM zinc finger family protein n=1 Tax=Bacillus sp. EB600 TaxID=2806345 RepID=UPI00210D23D0|nr:SWIM zinc finger family protein [Bacillus sp. EB600]MCQ6279988.1 SWIM zinc finger family protein [Bacillus sp. EB600]